MISFAVAFLVSLLVAAIATPLVLKVALARELYDLPDERKVHTRPIPRLGGVAIVLAFFAPVTGLLLIEAGASIALTQSWPQIIGLYVGGILIAAIGVYDDIKGANAVQKLVVQVGVAVLMFFLDYRIDAISDPFGGGAVVLGTFALPVTVLWFVGVINAVNLIDGLDGLASGIGLISVTVLFALALMGGNTIAALFCASLAGALGGFLIFNFNPARIFMGDTGSLFLGFVLAAFSISTSSKGSTTIALMVPVLALGLPIIDTFLAIGRRVRKQRPIFSADQDHIHHKLLRAGLSHRQAVLTMYVIAAFLAGAALLLRVTSDLASGLILLVVAVILFVLFRLLVHRNPDVRGISDPMAGDAGPDRVQVQAFCARVDEADRGEVIGALLDELALSTRLVSATVSVDDAALYSYRGPFDKKAALRGITDYRIPLGGAGGELNLQFTDAGIRGDLAVILPWELVAASLTRALDRLGWPSLAPAPVRTARQKIALRELADSLPE
ncbi:MAG: undecaprenyl/decaprenyl-phosphate alpha-N-acetylglucosaminyl 1-phosphate transferase [Deltaproteobacteria bacterium]|nr:MAG: undecaprenyl/decaprenyl-phosphate alpha-N-acetylglucosaminyl 1-phosphate transferase [Deltaproteobacteria bacterium]